MKHEISSPSSLQVGKIIGSMCFAYDNQGIVLNRNISWNRDFSWCAFYFMMELFLEI